VLVTVLEICLRRVLDAQPWQTVSKQLMIHQKIFMCSTIAVLHFGETSTNGMLKLWAYGVGEDEAHDPSREGEVPGKEGEAGAGKASTQGGQDHVQIAAASEC